MKVNPQRPPPISPEEFQEWLDILHYAAGSKLASLAVFLDRTPVTLYKWQDGGHPTEWWWRAVFEDAVYHYLNELHIMKRSYKSSTIQRGSQGMIDTINRDLDRLRTQFPSALPLRRKSLNRIQEARLFLIRVMKPNKEYEAGRIKQKAINEGIDLKALYRAGEMLALHRRRVFQGPAYWTRYSTDEERATHTDD